MWILNLQRWLAALVLACAITGCGGGGGGGSPPRGSGPSVSNPADTSAPDTGVAEVHQTGTHTTNSITFTPGSEAGATFEGSLDGADFVSIPVPWHLTDLADGEHTVAIRARDAAGNADPTPFSFTWRIDTTAPIASIAFPLPMSATDATTITVRGSATDMSAVASVDVNGIPAQSIDGFATWSATVPLSTVGATALTVSTSDAVGHQASSADTATVFGSGTLISDMRGMDYDAARNRIVVSDRRTNTIYGFDADTGVATVISPNHAPGAVPLTNNIEGLVIDANGNRALVVDSRLDALIAVDLDTGVRTVLTNNNIHQPEAQFTGAIGLTLDAINNRAFVGNGTYASIIEVDLDTGDRTVIAQSLPGDPEPFFNPVSLAYDDQTIPGSPRLIVADVSGTISKIIHIDLASGIHTLFVPTGVSLGTPIAMKLDAARGRLLVVDDRSNRLLAVDLSTTDLTVVGSNEDGLGESLDPTYGIAIKTSSEPKIFTGQVLGEVLSTDITTRARSTLVASRLGTGPRMPLVSSVVIEQSDGAATSLLAADIGKLVRIDLASGNRTLISDSFMEGGVPAGGIADIAIDRRASAHAPSALALLFGMQSLVSVDLSTGQITQAANLDSADPPVTHPWSMALDAPANRVLFISQDTEPSALDAIYEIELSSGTRRTITDIDTGTGPSLIEAVDLVLEPTPTPTRAIVSDNVQGALLWVDLSTGHRSELTPLGQAFRPGQLFLDSGNGRVIGYDHAGHGALFAADLATGHRHVISGNDLFDTPKGSGPLLGNAQGLDVDTFSQVAFVTDMASGAVLAVDLLTGERVIVAH